MAVWFKMNMSPPFCLFVCFVFETSVSSLPQAPECCDYRCVPTQHQFVLLQQLVMGIFTK